MTTTLLLADDHPLVRQGIRSLIEGEAGYKVIGEVSDGLAALTEIERLQPNVAILDVVMPGLTGLEVARRVKEQNLKTQVIIVSMYSDEVYVMEALRAGAFGYVTKDSSPGTLLEAISEVREGRHYLCQSLTERAIQLYIQRAGAELQDDYDTLTGREREVLHLASQGLTNVEIAERLSISYRTVEVHRGNMMRKLNLNSQLDLIRYAVKRGILKLDGPIS